MANSVPELFLIFARFYGIKIPSRTIKVRIGTATNLLLVANLLFEEFGATANDLPDGDSGVVGRGVRWRKADGATADGATGKAKGKGKKRKKSNIVAMGEWEWDSAEEFDIDMLIGKLVVTDGKMEVPGRGTDRFLAGAILYKVLWKGFPPEVATWEVEDVLPDDLIIEYETGLEEEEEEMGEGEEEEGSDTECE